MANLKFQRNDGGRAKAGYSGNTGDCVPRALSIALGLDYDSTYRKLTLEQNSYIRSQSMSTRRRNRRTVSTNERDQGVSQGINKKVYGKILEQHGWKHISLWNRMTVRQAALNYGPDCVLRSTAGSGGHLVAIIGGEMQDSWDSRNRKNVWDVWVPTNNAAIQPITPATPVIAAPAPRPATPVATRVIHGVGPNIGEVLPRIFTEEIRMRIVAQANSGASVAALAQGWGRSEASIKKIVARLGSA